MLNGKFSIGRLSISFSIEIKERGQAPLPNLETFGLECHMSRFGLLMGIQPVFRLFRSL
jgi:hypothetical protein